MQPNTRKYFPFPKIFYIETNAALIYFMRTPFFPKATT